MDTDVAVIGGGPVGLTLANLLGRRGASVLVLEKQPEPYPMPRAIHFDGEVMRVFQAAGVAQAVLPHTHVGKGMLFQNGAGETLVDWSRAQEIGPMGWYESYRFFQPGLEAALRDALVDYPNVRLVTGAEVIRLSQSGDAVTLTLGSGTQHRARFAIGADGTGSVTRQALGIALEDLGFQERWLVVDLRLTRPRDDLGDYSIQFCDPEAPGTYVRGVGNWRRWELRLSDGDPDPMPEEMIWQRLRRWITPRDAVLERGAIYTFRSRIAEHWEQGRILLAGDAAHQMPPFMGQGMCAGIRDAANLWWKLLAVLRGADQALLGTYGPERAANVRAFIEKSVALGRLINQTAAGLIPQGQMRSIWPDLGPGLGPRDGIGGSLAPQVLTPNGKADDAAGHRFYALGAGAAAGTLPKFDGAEDWLAEHACKGAIIRPDGYALGPASDPELVTLAEQLNQHLA
ncbi:3-(3-hydroxy-phenyl)propionate hydroxylase [Candidatus Rhodobacter oscarellae]|uniref:3-(3-hydroxy-phenyl)propionate hydroxylase n=1 Tax=Candidatus Rhodobacter oscarellae TaxID=1675527 RepID=A0A0J9EA03_9RHOB|nr:bifunctional 3-(3-hydroxy-phenyl)propionate/3-hydroxycinnamic acid hydroxylase [Candidatus Rhodobacter lobularis]KMW59476.1 3-(3-hydroxy-phenyl)propionate hydroxylase [Candidatus Rhodobacter lobularis]